MGKGERMRLTFSMVRWEVFGGNADGDCDGSLGLFGS
jgi:hypothetical protein